MNTGVTQLDENEKVELAIFKPRSWLLKIDFINHLVLFNNLLITVLAETDGGKTSFGKLLQNNLDQNIKSVTMTVKAPCDRQQMMQQVVSQLHLNNEMHINFSSLVAQVNERKAHVLMIIDDAHYLPEDLLQEALFAIKEQGDFCFFHICLISDYSVVATLNQLVAEPLKHLVHTVELGSLSESETRTYVLQRALLANLINKPLTDPQFKRLYQLTKGNLAIINSQLESFILDAPTKKNKYNAVLKQAATPLGAACLIAGLYIAGASYLNFGKVTVQQSAAPLLVAQEQSTQPISYVASWQDASTHELMFPALAEKQNLDGVVDEAPVNLVTAVDKVTEIPAIYVKKPKQEIAVISKNKVKLESQLVKIEGFTTNKSPIPGNHDAKRYTIQLVASHQHVDIKKFRKNNELLAQTKVMHYSNARGSWYILTLGEFTSRNQAQEKASHLPSGLARFNPWVRPVSGLEQIG
jgi:type II secretory pathway predicted ATPase ExeA